MMKRKNAKSAIWLEIIRFKYIGRKVQWVSCGQEMFNEPQTCLMVDSFYNNKKSKTEYFVFVDGVSTGIPLDEVELV